MYIFVGLGNPGTRYEGTRHNMGFDVIDRIIEDNRIPFSGRKFHSFLGSGRIGAEKIIVAKPVTYMNLSGTAVREIVDFYKIDPANELVVISDDIDLEAGGQNGLKHIIQCLGTQEFIRIRVGTGAKPADWDLADWVLSRFPKDERKVVDEAIVRAAKACETIVTDGVDRAMNLYNG